MLDKEKLKEEFAIKNGYEPTDAELDLYLKNNKLDKPAKPRTVLGDISGYLFLFWFLTSIITLVYASGMEEQLTLYIAFGQYFPIFFLYIALGNTKFSILAPIVGFLAIFVAFNPTLILGNIEKLNIEALFPMFLGFAFLIAGIFLMYFYKRLGKEKNVKYVHVFGKVSAHDENSDGLIACFYEYEFNGTKYNTLIPVYTNYNIPNIGNVEDIMVNPNNPNNIYLDKKNPIFIFLSWIFIITGFLVMFFGICFLFK